MMKKIEEIILRGIGAFGRNKTFTELLTAAGVSIEKSEIVRIATHLQDEGLIQNVTYRLPLALRADLSAKGRTFIDSLAAEE